MCGSIHSSPRPRGSPALPSAPTKAIGCPYVVPQDPLTGRCAPAPHSSRARAQARPAGRCSPAPSSPRVLAHLLSLIPGAGSQRTPPVPPLPTSPGAPVLALLLSLPTPPAHPEADACCSAGGGGVLRTHGSLISLGTGHFRRFQKDGRDPEQNHQRTQSWSASTCVWQDYING